MANPPLRQLRKKKSALNRPERNQPKPKERPPAWRARKEEGWDRRFIKGKMDENRGGSNK
ncbi:hypothetical protein TeGR_g6901, partial [Tetraparma gracilis]